MRRFVAIMLALPLYCLGCHRHPAAPAVPAASVSGAAAGRTESRVDPELLVALMRPTSKPEAPRPPRPPSPPAERAGVCVSNLRQLAEALRCYALDFDDTMPPADVPVAEPLRPYLSSADVALCPADAAPPSYALTMGLGCARTERIPTPAREVAIFESEDGRAMAWRHGGAAFLSFADGHVQRALRDGRATIESEPSGLERLGAALDPSHSYAAAPAHGGGDWDSAEGRTDRLIDCVERASWAYQGDTGRLPSATSNLVAKTGPPGYRGPYLGVEPIDPETDAPFALSDGQVRVGGRHR